MYELWALLERETAVSALAVALVPEVATCVSIT